VVVVNPGWGDAVQANKAGLLEVADVFCVNKADRPGAAEARRDLEQMLDMTVGHDWRPPVVEESSVAQSLELARAAGARLQIAHASTAHAVELVSRARADGVPATVETCPHYLFLDESELDTHGTFAKINPPLRPVETVAALWDKVRAGEVDVVGSDHSPFLVEEKSPDDGDVWKALPGAPGLEALVPLLLTALDDGRLRLEQLVALTSGNAARIYGLSAKGRLAVGADADLTVAELGGPWRIDPSTWKTRCFRRCRFPSAVSPARSTI